MSTGGRVVNAEADESIANSISTQRKRRFWALKRLVLSSRCAFPRPGTTLHIAAVRGDLAAIAALLDAGADIRSRGEHGYSPLHEAVAQGHIEAVRLLLERGASVSATCDDGRTPIQSAQILKEHEIERVLQNHAA